MPTLRIQVLVLVLTAAAFVLPAAAQTHVTAMGHSSAGGWVVSDGRLVARDTRAGAWRDITPGLNTFSNPDAVTRAAGGTFWIVSLSTGPGPARYDVYRSEDEGRTWSQSTFESAFAEVGSVTVVSGEGGSAWLLGRRASSSNFADGELWATSDGGRSWARKPTPPSSGRLAVSSRSALVIVGGPESDRLFESDEGAARWYPVADGRRLVETGETTFGTPVRDSEGWRVSASVRGGDAAMLEVWSWTPSDRRLQRRTLLRTAGLDRVQREQAIRPGLPAARVRDVLAQLNSAGVTSVRDVVLDERYVAAQVEMASPTDAWVLLREGRCAAPKQQCRELTTLLATTDGGETFADITPSTATGAAPRDVALSENRGFDKCTAASVSQLQTWWTESPYRDVNAYIGGISRGCAQPLLNAAWVGEVFAQGWRIIPTWVGYQAPCTSCTSCRNRFSLDAADAEAEGVREADRASDTAATLALPSPTVVYIDLEAYASNDGPCRTAVSAFVGGWSRRMRERGHVAGVYGSATNASQDWTGIAHRPDAVWIGKWDLRDTPWGLTPLGDAEWNAHQRIHQYRGGHDETWGGVTFNIDNDVEDGPVAAPMGVALPDSTGPDVVVESPQPDAVVPDTRVRVRGIASDAGRGDSGIARVTVNGMVADGGRAPGRDVASWSAEIDLQPGSAAIDVEAVDDSAQHNATRRSVRITIGPGPVTPSPPPPGPEPPSSLPTTPTLLVPDLTDPRDVWVDARHAFWVDAAGRLGHVTLDAARNATIVDLTLDAPTAVTGDDASIFVADARGLWRYRRDPSDGGALLPAEWLTATEGDVSGLARLGSFLVYAERATGRVMGLDVTTGVTTMVAASADPRDLQVVGDRVGWIEAVADGAVRTVGIDGTDDRRVVRIANGRALWITDARVLWTHVDEDGMAGRLMVADRNGEGARPLVEGLLRPAGVRQVGDAVYVAEAMPDGAVWRTRVDGSGAERVAAHASEPTRLVATDKALVWIERASGTPGAGRLVGVSIAQAAGTPAGARR